MGYCTIFDEVFMKKGLVTTENFIHRSDTNIIKGIAIIMMLIHHFFTIPNWWISSVSEYYSGNHFDWFENSFKLCVPLFAFLTGYFYWYAKNKNYRYSLRKITDIWVNYLIVWIIILIVCTLLGKNNLTLVDIITETFALSQKMMVFCWYVFFYIGTMMLLPLFYKLLKKNIFIPFIISITIPRLITFMIFHFEINEFNIIAEYAEFFYYLPAVIMGMIVAKYNVFERIYYRINSWHLIIKIILSSLCLILSFILRRYTIFLDFIFAPMFIFGLENIIRIIKNRSAFYPVSILGKYSLLIWFIHCIFFNQCKDITQPILYFPRNPVLVTIWGLMICLGIAFLINIPISNIIKLKNKIIST